jgi:ubiquinone/menaquinone biosynthesis C-methylase UbiE
MTHKTSKSHIMDTQKAQRFNHLAKTALAPANPVIARQIKETCGIISGTAIDVGSGPALLAIELARITSLRIYAMDLSEAMHPIATENILNAGCSDRIFPVTGDAEKMPCPDASADLMVSRGAAFFWEEPAAAFRECRRVLKIGGKAFIGGGFGSESLLAEIKQTMDTIDPTWIDGVRTRLGTEMADRFRDALGKAGIQDYEILHDSWQLWVIFGKEDMQ